jgi:hypothetical protein
MESISKLETFQDLHTILYRVGSALDGLEQGDLTERQFGALVKIDSLLFDAIMVLDSMPHAVRARTLDGQDRDPDLMEGHMIVSWHLSGPGARDLRSPPADDPIEWQVREQIVGGLADDNVAGELSASQGDDLYEGWWKIDYESDIQ